MKLFSKIILTASLLLGTAVAPYLQATPTATASAATGYTSASQVEYEKSGKYIHNWGAREEDCTFLSPMALQFYTGSNTYEVFSQKSGSSSQSNVPSSALYSALKTFMTSKHTYRNGYKENNDLLRYTDCLEGGGKISSFYSGKLIGPSWDSAATWNKEHTWPNSKGLGGQDEDDVMMIRPTAVSENSSRGNTAYGESSSYYDPNDESNGKYNLHGDCARIVLYTYTRWGNTSKMWGASGVMENANVLFKWMAEDPVDTWEMGRNDAVQAITGTRNVFVDYPELAWLMFGKSIPNTLTTPSGIAKGMPSTPDTPVFPDEPVIPDEPDTPTIDPTNAESILKAAYALGTNETLGTYTLTGTITNIKEKDSSTNNICLTFVVDGFDEYPMYCHWLQKGYDLEVGDTITVSGEIKNYKGTVEFNKPNFTLASSGGNSGTQTPDEPDTPTTPASGAEKILKDAYALADGATLSGTHTLTGTITDVDQLGETTNDICLTFVVEGFEDYPMYCYWLQGGNFLKVGDTITVSGTIKNYQGLIEYHKPTLVSYVVGGTQTPDEPEVPDTPTTPDVPETPDTPTTPDAPETPDTPTTPDVPTTPPTGENEPCKDGEHTFGEWTITKEATETEFGKMEHSCTKCGHVEETAISKLPSAEGCNATVALPIVALLIPTAAVMLLRKKRED